MARDWFLRLEPHNLILQKRYYFRNPYYWYELYKLNKKLGHRNDIFRNVEDSFVLKYGNFSKEDQVLDIGSGESAVPVFIRTTYSSTVRVTDLDTGVLEIQKRYCSILNCSLKIEAQDATKLTYPAGYFDEVIAISSIEHIPENGDTLSVKEFSSQGVNA